MQGNKNTIKIQDAQQKICRDVLNINVFDSFWIDLIIK